MYMKYKDKMLYSFIIMEIKKNSKTTEKGLADKYLVSERTIRRYIKELKDNKQIYLKNIGKEREWKIL